MNTTDPLRESQFEHAPLNSSARSNSFVVALHLYRWQSRGFSRSNQSAVCEGKTTNFGDPPLSTAPCPSTSYRRNVCTSAVYYWRSRLYSCF